MDDVPYLTFGESIPVPKATVVTTIRTAPLGSVKDAMIFLVFGEEQAVNFSHTRTVTQWLLLIILNLPTQVQKISELSLYVRQKII